MSKGEEFEREVITDTVRRVLNILERNLVLKHTDGLRGYIDTPTTQRLHAIRTKLFPGTVPGSAFLSSSDQQPTTGVPGGIDWDYERSRCLVEQPPEQEKPPEEKCGAPHFRGVVTCTCIYRCTESKGHSGPHRDERYTVAVWPERRGAGSDRRQKERRAERQPGFLGRRNHKTRKYRNDGTQKSGRRDHSHESDRRKALVDRRLGRRAGDQ